MQRLVHGFIIVLANNNFIPCHYPGNVYSARLYNAAKLEKKVIFCICLYHPQYIKVSESFNTFDFHCQTCF